MRLFRVDRERCDKDGVCIAICPVRIIRAGEDDGVPLVAKEREAFCLHCGHCAAACPRGAISLDGIPSDELLPLRKELLPSAASLTELLRSRRSVRHYRSQPVAREVMEQLLETVRYAPTGSNAQANHFVVVEQPDKVRELAGLVVAWMKGQVAEDALLTRRLNLPGVIRSFEQGKDPIFRGAPQIIAVHAGEESVTAAEDAAIALTYLELAAAAQGLGTCWAGFLGFTCQDPAVRRFFDLPADHELHGAIMIGHPRYKFFRLPQRRAPQVRWL